MRKFFLIAGCIIAVLVSGLGFYVWLQQPKPILTVTTWAGEYGRAQQSALFQPYGDKAGIDVRPSLYAGGLDELREAVRTKVFRGDVIDFELPDAISACNEGLLERLDPPENADDFVPGAIGPCWIGSVIYSRIIAYAPDKVQPNAAADFFDVRNFPGQRGVRRNGAKYNLELALLADGAAPEEVYALLATEEGISRALKKYQDIKPSIVWWSSSSEPLQLLAGGQVVMSTMPNENLFKAATHKQQVGAIWDRQLYEMEAFGIAKGTPKLEMAKAFLSFAVSPEGMAGVAAWHPYGPARRSAWDRVGQNPELKIDMTPFSPTADGHFATAFAVDNTWWMQRGALAEARWQSFVNQ